MISFLLQGLLLLILSPHIAPIANTGGVTSQIIIRLMTWAAYGASAWSVTNGVLTKFSHDEWSAMGIIAGIVVAVLTLATNTYFKWHDSRAVRNALVRRDYPVIPNIHPDQ